MLKRLCLFFSLTCISMLALMSQARAGGIFSSLCSISSSNGPAPLKSFGIDLEEEAFEDPAWIELSFETLPNTQDLDVRDLVFFKDDLYLATTSGVYSSTNLSPELTSYLKHIPPPNRPAYSLYSYESSLLVGTHQGCIS